MHMEGPCSAFTAAMVDLSDTSLHALLVNGKGWVRHPTTNKATGEPAIIRVEKGRRYRIRTIAGKFVQKRGLNGVLP